MSDSELLRINNKQKASYKSRKTARSNPKKILTRPNDRFGFKPTEHISPTEFALWLFFCTFVD